MKKRQSFIIIFMFITVIISGAAAEENPLRDLNQILASGKVRIAMVDLEFPPFITRTRDGNLEGLEVDMARDIADRLDVALEIVKTEYFDDVVGLVAGGKADIGLSNLSITCDRAKYIKFTDTYRTLGIILLLNRMKMASLELTAGLHRLNQIKGTTDTIGVIGSSAYATAALKYFPNAGVKTYTHYQELIQAAEKGEVLLAIGNSGTVNAFLKKSPRLLVTLQPFKVEGLRDHIAMAVGLESDHLMSWLNAYLTISNLSGRQEDVLNLEAGSAGNNDQLQQF